MKKIIAAVFASLFFAVLGGFILWRFNTTVGLCIGVFCEIMAVAIALPTPFGQGVAVLKTNGPLITEALSGIVRLGRRKTDPVAAVPPASDADAVVPPPDKP